MELQFNQVGKRWEAEFLAEADFNLHIERPAAGSLVLSQRGSESGAYDTAHAFSSYELVIDYDFTALVYPKFIKIVSEVKPTYAEVTFAATSGGSGSGNGASGDDVLFFDFKMLYDNLGYDVTMIPMLFDMSSFINKTTYYTESYTGKIPCSDASVAQGTISFSEISYVCVSNSLTPTVVLAGSGALEIPKQEEPIGVYEFFEILTGLGMTLPIELFKEAEVSREVVEQWMQE